MSKKKNIIVLTSWNFKDGLIQSYTLPYLRIIKKYLPKGSIITLVTLEKNVAQNNLILFEEGIVNLQLKYIPFSAKAGWSWLMNLWNLFIYIRKNKIVKIHAWCTPSGMMGYILSLITFRKLIIDSYEPHAESMVENGEWSKDGIAFRLLFAFERLQTKKAEYIIATTKGMKEYARIKYGFKGNNIFVKPACVDLEQFSIKNIKDKTLTEKYQLKNKIVGLYCGKFGGIYLKEEIFELFKIAIDYWNDRFKILLLTSHSEKEIFEWAKIAGIDSKYIIVKFINHTEIANYIGLADFAITPVKSIPTKRFCTPVKDGEYWAMGLPVIITKNISDDSQIIEENNAGFVLNELNTESYHQAIEKIDYLISNNLSGELYYRIRYLAENYRNFKIADEIYEKIYSDE